MRIRGLEEGYGPQDEVLKSLVSEMTMRLYVSESIEISRVHCVSKADRVLQGATNEESGGLTSEKYKCATLGSRIC